MLKEITGLPAGVQGLEAVGTLTQSDYYHVFAPIIDEVRRSGGRMRLLYQFGSDFRRLTAGALWADTKFGLRYVSLLDGCAVVSDEGWIRAPAEAIGRWMPCPVRVYANTDRDDAIAWLASLPRGCGGSPFEVARSYVGGVGAAIGSLIGLLVHSTVETRRLGR
ncbi:hypothetical protein A5787_23590 [Mycobacterium sp. 852002-50816_SCH5313054-b]|uniref:STAS/SEC14 domain-containing protein n=1 Tax=Mycobacterium sp. 852002-50816_SCH5313054-b TaxID=1834092 RepID=UPI0007FD355D|nr:STAS/SEC14 domain-containing protein [Mycobacterium sp. 852002-50816_SCH5313054-b]OBF57998.1 hypothetical protein A5787_23590 [Mycobacterium sp. 852002-50816_SCH5313054-b]